MTIGNSVTDPRCLLTRYRWSLGLFLVGLIISGLTAFPLLTEVRLLARAFGIEDATRYAELSGLRHWIGFVLFGLEQTQATFPFVAYGTDWLAFGHLALAGLIAGAWFDPVGRSWILRYALWLCAAVIPTAFIAGGVRGIPVAWRMIDCSFGVFGALPLLYCLQQVRLLQAAGGSPE